jgi:hypothetical protein
LPFVQCRCLRHLAEDVHNLGAGFLFCGKHGGVEPMFFCADIEGVFQICGGQVRHLAMDGSNDVLAPPAGVDVVIHF